MLKPLERGQEFEVIAELAAPLPGALITGMMGVPVSERAIFTGWADDLVAGNSTLGEPEHVMGACSKISTGSTLVASQIRIWPSGRACTSVSDAVARLEARQVLTGVLRRAPECRVTTAELPWRRGFFVRGLEELSISLASVSHVTPRYRIASAYDHPLFSAVSGAWGTS